MQKMMLILVAIAGCFFAVPCFGQQGPGQITDDFIWKVRTTGVLGSKWVNSDSVPSEDEARRAVDVVFKIDKDGIITVKQVQEFIQNQRDVKTTKSQSFTNSGQALGNSDSRSVALGDLDGDGDLDAVVANYNQPNTVWTNDGSGTFTNSGQAIGDRNSWEIALGDLEGDGDLDAVVANYNQPNTVWTNDGTGTFTNSGQTLGNGNSASVALGDLDGDGDLDALVANTNSPDGQPNTVWTNDGNGNFINSGQRLGNSDSASVALGDFDGDGDLDAMFANFYQPNTIWTNDGTGTFTDSGQALEKRYSTSVALGDLDGDGDLDAVIANYSRHPDVIWKNNGRGVFTKAQDITVENKWDIQFGGNRKLGSYGTSIGDIDKDGDLDVIIVTGYWNDYEGEVDIPHTVWINRGDGTFTVGVQTIEKSNAKSVALGDLDDDGDLDAMVTNDGGPNTIWIKD